MAQRLTRRFCSRCRQVQWVEVAEPNHLLHGVLTLLTVGLWLIPWLILSAAGGGLTCVECGWHRPAKGRGCAIATIFLFVLAFLAGVVGLSILGANRIVRIVREQAGNVTPGSVTPTTQPETRKSGRLRTLTCFRDRPAGQLESQ